MDFINGARYLKSISLDENISEQGNYWQALPFYKSLENGGKIDFSAPVTFLVGENGCGKSTLTEAIAVALGYNAEGGSRNFSFQTFGAAYGLADEILTARINYEKDGFFLRAESFFNVATEIERLDAIPTGAPKISLSYGGKSLHNQSHGESFLALVQNRFSGNGLYILDEPEAALSPMRLLTLIAEISRLVNANSQFIIATHSPILLSYPNAAIYRLDNGIELVTLEETEHYRITKDFLNNRERFLNRLVQNDL